MQRDEHQERDKDESCQPDNNPLKLLALNRGCHPKVAVDLGINAGAERDNYEKPRQVGCTGNFPDGILKQCRDHCASEHK